MIAKGAVTTMKIETYRCNICGGTSECLFPQDKAKWISIDLAGEVSEEGLCIEEGICLADAHICADCWDNITLWLTEVSNDKS